MAHSPISMVLSLLLATMAYGGPSAKTDTLIRTGIRLSIQQNYPDATAVFEQLKNEMPESPIGYFFHAAVLQTQMMDYEVYDDDGHFISLVDSALERAKKQIKNDHKDPAAYFYLGSSHGYLSLHFSRQGKYWQALRHAKRSAESLQVAVSKDSTFHDAYLGLGWYKYYRSKLSHRLSWLPFIRDEREDGKQMIMKALTGSRYSRYSALNSMCWILLDEGEYERGLQLVESVLVEFPDSRVFLWCAAKLNKKLGDWQKSLAYYQKILSSLTEDQVLSPYNELVCRKNISQLSLKLGHHDRAKQECRNLERFQQQSVSDERYKKELQQMITTCQECREVLIGRTN